MTIDELKDYIHSLGTEWTERGKFKMPDKERAVSFMVTEAAEALSAALSAADSGFVRNNPDKVRDWSAVDVEVADTIIMALRYFALRPVPVEAAVLAKIKKMDEGRRV